MEEPNEPDDKRRIREILDEVKKRNQERIKKPEDSYLQTLTITPLQTLALTPYYSDVAQGASELTAELEYLRSQLNKMQRETVTSEQLSAAVETASRALQQGSDLTAKVLLPPPEDMNVRLVTSNSLDRLEEYRSDENIVFLLMGLFGGAVLGILSNWVTNENFVITRPSVMLLALFAVAVLASIYWARRIHTRVTAVKAFMFGQGKQTPGEKEKQTA